MSGRSDDRRGWQFYGLATVIVGISLFELFALFYWGLGTWLEKLGALLALVGVYGIALGFFAKNEDLAQLKEIYVGLTNPNPVIYISSNLLFGATVLQFGQLGLENRMEPGAPPVLSFLGLFIWLPVGVVLLCYVIFHVAVVALLAYVPLLIASAVIVRMKYASGDIIVRFGSVEVSLKSVFREDTVALKGFVMGVPALSLSVMSTVLKVILTTGPAGG